MIFAVAVLIFLFPPMLLGSLILFSAITSRDVLILEDQARYFVGFWLFCIGVSLGLVLGYFIPKV